MRIGGTPCRITPIGGLAVLLLNKTGGASVAGELVQASTTTDFAVEQADADGVQAIGAFLDDGVPDASWAWVVVSGICDVMLEDATAATHGNWVQVSGTAGRADATNSPPSPASTNAHFTEIGHCIQTAGAGSDVKARIVMHFL